MPKKDPLCPLIITEVYEYGELLAITASYTKKGYKLINSNYTEYYDDTGEFIYQFTGVFMIKSLFN